MEQILNKLSEIELTAQHIMEDCNQTKQQLSAEAEKNCQYYDQQLEAQTTAQIRQIRQKLEEEKDTRLSALRAETEATFPLWTHITMKITCAFPKNFSRRSWNCKKHC